MGKLHICNGKKLRMYGSKNCDSVCQCDIKDKENIIYTDGSLFKNTGQGGYSVYSPGLNIKMANPSNYREHKNNVLRLESKAILEAVKLVKEKHKTRDRFDIFTDSEHALTHLQLLQDGEEPLFTDDNDGLGKRILMEINNKNWPAQVHLHKVKAHSGVHGNETADNFARGAAKNAPKARWNWGLPWGQGRDNRDDEEEIYSSSNSFNSCNRKRLRISNSKPSPSPATKRPASNRPNVISAAAANGNPFGSIDAAATNGNPFAAIAAAANNLWNGFLNNFQPK